MKPISTKSKLGQFYTTNYNYILQNMTIPSFVSHIVEPFVGNGDLLNFIKSRSRYTIEMFDIDPKIDNTIPQDTLLNPPCYDNKFVITNPPYLAKNKNPDKTLYKLYDCNDLYKCFIMTIINSNCSGGIIIIPLNFLCSIRKLDIQLRQQFLLKFNFVNINIFEEPVFTDTSYSVCCISFINKSISDCDKINTYIYPDGNHIDLTFSCDNNFTIGGELYSLPINNSYKIERATRINSDNKYLTNILLSCIDGKDPSNKIKFSVVHDDKIFIDNTEKLSARSYATLIINVKLTIKQQKKLVILLNNYLNTQRKKYNSLFLTNYREGKRKRISFSLAYDICNYILSDYLS